MPNLEGEKGEKERMRQHKSTHFLASSSSAVAKIFNTKFIGKKVGSRERKRASEQI